ncbi:MAG: glycine zipper 2TM domain-containing protein [Betaproteobacteria bacterium]|nr:MAG: glycine zipper 2TM domain-containing protein [Betaproteobacteria bacterium]
MRIHPLMAGAAVSVIVLSGVGVAAMTGVLPKSNAEKPEQTQAAAAQKQAAAAPVCADCGVVTRVRAIEVKTEPTGVGAVIGGVAGAVVGHEIADGHRDLGTVVGAAGGAFAGHQIERQTRTKQRYAIQVRMNDGSTRTVTVDQPPAWRSGGRVRFRNGTLVADERPT